MLRVQEYSGDKILFDIDHSFLNNYLTAHLEAIHAQSNSAASITSMAMVEDSGVDG